MPYAGITQHNVFCSADGVGSNVAGPLSPCLGRVTSKAERITPTNHVLFHDHAPVQRSSQRRLKQLSVMVTEALCAAKKNQLKTLWIGSKLSIPPPPPLLHVSYLTALWRGLLIGQCQGAHHGRYHSGCVWHAWLFVGLSWGRPRGCTAGHVACQTRRVEAPCRLLLATKLQLVKQNPHRTGLDSCSLIRFGNDRGHDVDCWFWCYIKTHCVGFENVWP